MSKTLLLQCKASARARVWFGCGGFVVHGATTQRARNSINCAGNSSEADETQSNMFRIHISKENKLDHDDEEDDDVCKKQEKGDY